MTIFPYGVQSKKCHALPHNNHITAYAYTPYNSALMNIQQLDMETRLNEYSWVDNPNK